MVVAFVAFYNLISSTSSQGLISKKPLCDQKNILVIIDKK